MKTETEFNEKLKQRLRKGRKKLNPFIMARNLDTSAGAYFAYERGDIPMTVYQLYKFMHITGQTPDFIKTIFDDGWAPETNI